MAVHPEVFLGDVLVDVGSFLWRYGREMGFHFFDLAPDQDFVQSPLSDVGSNLLEDHNDDQVGHQSSKVTNPVCDDVVRYVRVDELEHVHLVDETVFVGVFVAVILPVNEQFGNDFISRTIEENEAHIDD